MELVCYVIMGFFPAVVILSMVSHRRGAHGSSGAGLSPRGLAWRWVRGSPDLLWLGSHVI